MKKNLIVDDSALFRKAVEIELYNQNNFSLIILDIEMPEKNGFEISEEIQKLDKYKNNQVPVIFFTSKDGPEFRKKGFELVATNFIKKK